MVKKKGPLAMCPGQKENQWHTQECLLGRCDQPRRIL